MSEVISSRNTPSSTADDDILKDIFQPLTAGQRITQLPLLLVKVLFPTTIFASFFISSIIPSMANILIPMFFVGNIPAAESLAVTSQFMFINIVLKVIHEGVGNSLFHFVGAHYERDKQLAISAFNLSLLVLLIAGMALTVMILLFTPQFVKLIDTPALISEDTKHYFYTSAFSFIPALLTTAFTNYLYISTSTWLAVAQVVIVLVSFLINFFAFGRQPISLHWGIGEFGIYTVVQSTATMLLEHRFELESKSQTLLGATQLGKAEYIFYQSLTANLIVYLVPWILNLFDILTPTYWLIMGMYIAGMLISCCLTTHFGVMVWKRFSDGDDPAEQENKM